MNESCMHVINLELHVAGYRDPLIVYQTYGTAVISEYNAWVRYLASLQIRTGGFPASICMSPTISAENQQVWRRPKISWAIGCSRTRCGANHITRQGQQPRLRAGTNVRISVIPRFLPADIPVVQIYDVGPPLYHVHGIPTR